jgi:hypothetical protein
MRRALIKSYFIALVIFLSPTIALGGSATISWNSNSDGDLAGYKVYYSATKGGPYGSSTALISKTQTSYTVSDLSPGTYYFVVVAVDTSHNESIYSAEVAKTIVSTPSAVATRSSSSTTSGKSSTTTSSTTSASNIALPANGTYGQISGNAGQSNEVSFSFPARAKKATIIYQAYNIDFSNKVSIIINGNTIGYAGMTKVNNWGGNRSITIPRTYLNGSSINTITFKNNSSSSTWGVRNIKVR